MATVLTALVLDSCAPINTSQETAISTLSSIDSLRETNYVVGSIQSQDNVFKTLRSYPISGFGHYHTSPKNYTAFKNMIPALRKAGVLVLAVEVPANEQKLLDKIMNPDTPEEETNQLLSELNQRLKDSDFNVRYDNGYNVLHPLFTIILGWLNEGGIVAAIDVPCIHDSSTRTNKYDTERMKTTIGEQSNELLLKLANVDINLLDDRKDLRLISEVRSAYMASMLNYYSNKDVRVVCFLGANHLWPNVRNEGVVTVSVPNLLKQYFDKKICTLYPYQTNDSMTLFYNGNPLLGNFAYKAN